MKRSKFAWEALRAAGSAQSKSSTTPSCRGWRTGKRQIVEGPYSFCPRWSTPFQDVLRNKELTTDQLTRGWDSWRSGAGAGLCLGAVTFPMLALAENHVDDEQKIAFEGTSGKSASVTKVDAEKVVKQVRKGIEERLQALKLGGATLPLLNVSAKGQQVSIRFFLSPSCDVSHLIVDMVNHLGGNVDGRDGGEMIVQAWDSNVARQLIISPAKQLPSQDDRDVTAEQSPGHLSAVRNEDMTALTNNLCILIFEPLIGDYKATEVEFLKKGNFTSKELDAIFSSLRIAGAVDYNTTQEKKFSKDACAERDSMDGWPPGSRWKYQPGGGEGPQETSARNRHAGRRKPNAMETLESMGVKIYGLNIDATSAEQDWDCIAGYHEQKGEIEDTLLLALKQPEVYDTIARGTRRKFESNRPRAILFEGPPGTGKTSCARIIANQAGLPLLYVPLEVVMSKYFGESEKLLASIFNTGNELPDGAILFLDEIDALAMARDSEMHEASRRMISVLLRQMDGFEQKSRIVVIAATNRKKDLDPALLSRFDTAILFSLPDTRTRHEIAAQYAQHLSAGELTALAKISEGMSGRDINDICRQAERRWASKIIRGKAGSPPSHTLPPIQEYIECAVKRRQNILDLHEVADQYFIKQPIETKDNPW